MCAGADLGGGHDEAQVGRQAQVVGPAVRGHGRPRAQGAEEHLARAPVAEAHGGASVSTVTSFCCSA